MAAAPGRLNRMVSVQSGHRWGHGVLKGKAPNAAVREAVTSSLAARKVGEAVLPSRTLEQATIARIRRQDGLGPSTTAAVRFHPGEMPPPFLICPVRGRMVDAGRVTKGAVILQRTADSGGNLPGHRGRVSETRTWGAESAVAAGLAGRPRYRQQAVRRRRRSDDWEGKR